MRLSVNWLKTYVDLEGISPEALAEALTTAGLEVEGITRLASGTKLCIGEVLECEDHPDSDHLHVTQTSVGDATYQIVCGAPNCRKGLKVIVALDGCELPGGTIKKSVIRGQESNGMLCSMSELGVDKHTLTEYQLAGIEELPQDAPVGEKNVLGYLGLDDTILEVGLTPNRADCSAMWNMAKEVGAIVHRKVTWPTYEGQSQEGKPSSFKVFSKTEHCPYFLGKVVHHVQVGPSPKWMQERLHAYGIKSINNVVDISNYVMVETGQPLHFYDLSKLPHQEITVVDDVDMTMTALDGVEYAIQKGDLLITTNGEPTGLAGIMGGEESKIDENTTSIFIEAASFDLVSIRNTSRRLNLMTEAAQRFSKGLEPLCASKAMDRSVQLLKEWAEASDFEACVEAGQNSYQPRVVEETLEHATELLGITLSQEQVTQVFTDLDFHPTWKDHTVTCTIPSYRVDIERNADLDEELIRLVGFEALKGTLPVMPATVGKLSPLQAKRRMTRNVFNGFGCHEIVTYTLCSDEEASQGVLPFGETLTLDMPMSEDRKNIRWSLMPSVLETVQYNQARKQNQVNVFEISSVYAQGKQQERLAISLNGELQSSRLHEVHIPGNFYTLKGMILDYLALWGFTSSRISIKPNTTDREHFHPYASAEVWLGKDLVGLFGRIHPTLAQKYHLDQSVYAELILDVLMNNKASKVRFEAIDRYPSVSRDLALVVDQETPASLITETITKTSKLVREVEIFDVYEGEHVAPGKKSVAVSIRYQSSDHTLVDQEVNEAHETILERLQKSTGATLRD